MAARNDLERGATIFTDVATRFKLPKAAAAIGPQRLIAVNTSGNATEAAANATGVVGANPYMHEIPLGKNDVEAAYGACFVIADQALTAGQRIKAANDGRVIQAVDADLTGDTIKTTGAGIAFTNQPANDGVEVVSNNAGDTTQVVTIIGTTNGTDTVVTEDVTLNGTTPVATAKTNWGVILAVKMSAAAAGTVTVREASGDLAITTLTAGQTSKGVETVTAADQKAYNQEPTVVADGATTKQIGLKGTDAAGTVIYDSQALSGTTAVTMNSEFKTVTEVYTGDLESTRTVTVKIGAEDSADVRIGRTLQSATAQGDRVLAFLNPR